MKLLILTIPFLMSCGDQINNENHDAPWNRHEEEVCLHGKLYRRYLKKKDNKRLVPVYERRVNGIRKHKTCYWGHYGS